MPEIIRDDGFNVGDTESDKYLGSPVVVGKLVNDFCNDVYEWTKARGNGSMSKDEMTEHLTNRISDIADIFMGRNNEYSGVMGWNNKFALGLSIKQTLRTFWDKYKDNYDNDPGKAQFGWLAASVVDAAISSLDDPDAAGASILAKKDQVIKVLLGLNKRA
jgi:hypothetical protein